MMRGKSILMLCLALAMTLALAAGCSGSSQPAKGDAKGDGKQELPEIALKLGHHAAENQPFHIGAVKLADIVKEKTNGRFKIDIYPNNTLGTSRDLIEGLQMGTVDMTLSPTTNMAVFYPKLDLFYLPFLFEDKNHVYKVADGEIGQRLYKELEDKLGIKTIAMFDSGFRHIENSKREIKTPEDVVGLKIRTIDTPICVDTFKALGANATPIAFNELFTALQQGTVDGNDSPIGNLYASRFYEVQKYCTLTGHQYAAIMVTISTKSWNKLPKEYQDILIQAAKEATAFQRKLAEDKENEFLKIMIEKGLKVTELTPEQKSLFQKKMEPIWNKYGDKIGKDLIDAALKLGSNK